MAASAQSRISTTTVDATVGGMVARADPHVQRGAATVSNAGETGARRLSRAPLSAGYGDTPNGEVCRHDSRIWYKIIYINLL